MFTALIVVVIVSGAVLAIAVLVKVREAKRSRIRRTLASPYGMLVGPTDAELRLTREVHPESLKIVGAWRENCPDCDGEGSLFSGGLMCLRCDGRGDILIQGEKLENDGKTSD